MENNENVNATLSKVIKPIDPPCQKDEKLIEEFRKYTQNKNFNSEYLDTLENNPGILFTSISKERIFIWESSLYQTIIPIKVTDNEILNIDLNHPNQKIIINDCLRTRVRESILYPGDFKLTLQKILTCFCKKYNIQYKQGLNEIFGPLILIQFKLKQITLSKIFHLGESLIKKFLVNYYFEDGFSAYRSSLCLFVLLLKYHAPEVNNLLDKLMILPEMYITSWIMTLLSSKLRLDVTFHIWDHIIQSGDNLLIFFILVAFLKERSTLILSTDYTLIPNLMTNLVIFSIDEVDSLLQHAYNLRNKTPYSFRMLADKLEIFNEGSKTLKKNYNWLQTEGIDVMPLFPSEIFYITYKKQIKCPDHNCKILAELRKQTKKDKAKEKSKSKKSKRNDSSNSFDSDLFNYHICEHCDMKLYKQINYLFLDLRISESDEDKMGMLPMTIAVDQDELKSNDFPEKITDRFIPDKGNLHFIFLTSHTDSFNEFENNFYSEKLTEDDLKNRMYGIETKINKVLDIQKAEQNKSKNDILKLKEYDNLKITLQCLLKENFPYIAYVYGGFNSLHKEISNYGLSLLNHEEEDCVICSQEGKNKKKKTSFFGIFKKSKKHHKSVHNKTTDDLHHNTNNTNEIANPYTHSVLLTSHNNTSLHGNNLDSKELISSLWKRKEKFKYTELYEILHNKKNFYSFCQMKEFNGLSDPEGPVQVLLCLRYEEKEMELYQVEKRKVYDAGKKQVTNVGVKAVEVDQSYNNRQKEMELTLTERVLINNIESIKRDQNTKTIVTVTYYKKQEENENNKKKSNKSKKHKKERDKFTFVLDLFNKTDINTILCLVRDITSGEIK